MTNPVPIHIVRGNDEILLAEAVQTLVTALVGTDDRSLILDEYTGADYELAAAVDAAQTPPLFTDRRIVVMRQAGRFSKAADVGPLVDYLADPLATSVIVLVWEIAPGQQRLSAIPKKLNEAVTASGGQITVTDVASGRGARDDWWSDQLAASAVSLDARAMTLLRDQIGEDFGEVPALLRRLEAAYDDGAKLSVDQLQPFLGGAGSVPPWELTDGIDRGDARAAIDALHRMLGSGDRHPLQIMASLQSHYLRIAKLDGSGARNERDAAAALGIKGSTFPARKALDMWTKLGRDGIGRAIALLAEADLTLRGGGVAWPGELVLEVLVARLARLGGKRPARR